MWSVEALYAQEMRKFLQHRYSNNRGVFFSLSLALRLEDGTISAFQLLLRITLYLHQGHRGPVQVSIAPGRRDVNLYVGSMSNCSWDGPTEPTPVFWQPNRA